MVGKGDLINVTKLGRTVKSSVTPSLPSRGSQELWDFIERRNRGGVGYALLTGLLVLQGLQRSCCI
jgi:hypothetical protein